MGELDADVATASMMPRLEASEDERSRIFGWRRVPSFNDAEARSLGRRMNQTISQRRTLASMMPRLEASEDNPEYPPEYVDVSASMMPRLEASEDLLLGDLSPLNDQALQ